MNYRMNILKSWKYNPYTGLIKHIGQRSTSQSWRTGGIDYRGEAYVFVSDGNSKITVKELAYMQMVGSTLPKDKIIVHRNQNITDNRWENLMVLPKTKAKEYVNPLTEFYSEQSLQNENIGE